MITIEAFRAELQDKKDRGVKQIYVTTVLKAIAEARAPVSEIEIARRVREAVTAEREARAQAEARADAAEEALAKLRRKRSEDSLGDPYDYVGTAEAAEILGVERPRIGKWRALGRMPQLVADLAAGPVWRREDIEAMKPETVARRRGDRRLDPAVSG